MQKRIGWVVASLVFTSLCIAGSEPAKKCQFDAKKPGFDSVKWDSEKETAIQKWVKAELTELQKKDPKASFEYLGDKGGDLEEIIEVRSTVKGKCLEGYRALDVRLDKSGCAFEVKGSRPYAENCCAGETCAERAPVGWMLELFRRSDQYDTNGLLGLISPSEGYSDTYLEEPTKKYSRAQGQVAADAIKTAWAPGVENLHCDPQFSTAGHAKCIVSRSGWVSEYHWTQNPAGTFLRSHTHKDSGE